MEHTSIAVVTERGRARMLSIPLNRAVLYRSVSLVSELVAFDSSCANLKRSSAVVTMFSISELACAFQQGNCVNEYRRVGNPS